jgi:hypothetical protein
LPSARITNAFTAKLKTISVPSSAPSRTAFVGTQPSGLARPLGLMAVVNMTESPFAEFATEGKIGLVALRIEMEGSPAV